MGCPLLGAFFVENVLYLVKKKKSGHCVLEKMNFTYDTKDLKEELYRVYLDGKTVVRGTHYDNATNTTLLFLSLFGDTLKKEGTPIAFVLPDGTYYQFAASELHPEGSIYLPGNHQGKAIIMGQPYTFTVALSPLYLRKQESDGRIETRTNGRLQIRTLNLQYANTGGFTVKVKSRGNGYQYRMTGRPVGRTCLDTMPLATGTFRVPIQAENTAYEMTIESDLPQPLSLIGFRFEGSFRETSKGV